MLTIFFPLWILLVNNGLTQDVLSEDLILSKSSFVYSATTGRFIVRVYDQKKDMFNFKHCIIVKRDNTDLAKCRFISKKWLINSRQSLDYFNSDLQAAFSQHQLDDLQLEKLFLATLVFGGASAGGFGILYADELEKGRRLRPGLYTNFFLMMAGGSLALYSHLKLQETKHKEINLILLEDLLTKNGKDADSPLINNTIMNQILWSLQEAMEANGVVE